jgi:hypothetical protein
MNRLCSACNQDHSKPLQKWCDRSDIEVEIENLQAENSALQGKLDLAVKTLKRLSQSGDGSHKDNKTAPFNCLSTLQIEYEERLHLASETLEELRKDEL